MAKPYFHAQSSAKKYGGIYTDYIEIHEIMDSSKAAFPDNRHRALTHQSWFIGFILPKIFGETFKRKSDGVIINTRDIGEQHVLEDFKMKFIPTPQDFLQEMDFLPWMQNGIGEEVPSSHKRIQNNKNITKSSAPTTPPIEEKTPETILEKLMVNTPTKTPIIPQSDVVMDGLGSENRNRGTGNSMTFD